MKTVEEIANELQGTCQHLGTVLERHDMDGMDENMDFCLALDNLVFCCDWWFEISECADEGHSHGICFECFGEG